MSDQFNPNIPAIPLGGQGNVLAMEKGSPVFVGGTTTYYNSATPVGVPSSGTIGNNGALSGITAMQSAYPDIFLFFPADAIFTGSTAGFYYCQMSSTSAGIIFNNKLLVGDRPQRVDNPTPFVSTGPGAYTQSTATQTFLSFVVPGGAMRNNGALEIYDLFSVRTSANNKTFTVNFGGQAVQLAVVQAIQSYENIFWIYNASRPNRQVLSPLVPTAFGGTTSPNVFLGVNTLVDFNITVTGNLSNAGDYLVLEAMTARIVNATG